MTLALAILQPQCGATPSEVECRTGTHTEPLVGGDRQAQYLRLSAEERRAIVGFSLDSGASCSGTLVSPNALLTAAHCMAADRRSGASVVLDLSLGGDPVGTFEARVLQHPHADVALLLLESPPSNAHLAPTSDEGSVAPIVLSDLELQEGDLMQVAGYGYDDYGGHGELNFAATSIVELRQDLFVVSNDGRSGLCDGDSGGPALTRGERGELALVGVLSQGSVTCRGQDMYVAASSIVDWVREALPSTSVSGTSAAGREQLCAEIGEVGACYSRTAVWCAGGQVFGELCSAGRACGWDGALSAFRCVDPEQDSCLGYSGFGRCEGDTAVFCRSGDVHQVPCALCGATCSHNPGSGSAECVADPNQPRN